MKFASLGLLRIAVVPLAVTLVICSSNSASAGWGVLRAGGSSGAYAAGYGSSGAVGASSGGYAAAYGSSGYTAGGSSGYSAAYGSSGYAASYGSSGAYASVGGSSGHPGLLGRLSAHLAAKRARHAARRAAYASSGGSSGYVAAHSGGSSGTVAYSGGSSGTAYRSSRVSYSGGSSGSSVSYAPAYSAPISNGSSGGSTYYGVSNSAKAPLTAFASNVSHDAVQLTVAVPSEAKVFVNGRETTSKGSVRQFVSKGLKEDKTYKFEIEAHMQAADGQDMVETKTVVVQAGQSKSLEFAFADYDKPIETALTLNVPEGAEVMLGGNSTKAVGSKRTYRTKQLKPGQVWDDYEVTVRVGDQVKHESVRLIAGDQLQLSFSFDEDPSKLASR